MANGDNPNIRKRQSIRPAGRPSTKLASDPQGDPLNTANFSKSLPNAKKSNMPTGVPSSAPMSSTPAMTIPKIKHSENASKAEKMLKSNSSLAKISLLCQFFEFTQNLKRSR